MKFISTILAYHYEPDRVHDYYSEGAETPEVSGWVITVSLIIAVYVSIQSKGGSVAGAIFGGLFLFGVVCGILHFIDRLFF